MEMIYQLNATAFYVFTPKETSLFINCGKKEQEKSLIIGYNIINMEPGCRASLNHHIFSSGIEIEEITTVKQTRLHLHLKEIAEISEHEEKAFIKILKEERAIGTKRINIIDVKRKYHLKTIQKHHGFLAKLFGSVTSIIIVTLVIIIGLWLMKRCRNMRNKRSDKNDTFIQMSNLIPPHENESISTVNTTLSNEATTTKSGETFQITMLIVTLL